MARGTPSLFDVIIIGAGAAGLMCALTAGARGRRVLLLDHANEAGKKILISGGGRCNFTNINSGPENFLSANPHFCKSALARYTQHDFIALIEKYRIAWHEKTLGQLFCDGSARAVVAMLLAECDAAGVDLRLSHRPTGITRSDQFDVATDHGNFAAPAVVLASGGLSIPKMGATGFAHDVARNFGLPLTKADLDAINAKRRDTKYLSSESAILNLKAHNARAGAGEQLTVTDLKQPLPCTEWYTRDDGEMIGWPDPIVWATSGQAGADRVTERLLSWPANKHVVESAPGPRAAGQVGIAFVPRVPRTLSHCAPRVGEDQPRNRWGRRAGEHADLVAFRSGVQVATQDRREVRRLLLAVSGDCFAHRCQLTAPNRGVIEPIVEMGRVHVNGALRTVDAGSNQRAVTRLARRQRKRGDSMGNDRPSTEDRVAELSIVVLSGS